MSDAEVRVVFSMAAMPSMNMPAMHADARLQHLGAEVYSGTAAIAMRGRWDMAITVSRPAVPSQLKRMSIIVQ